LLRGFLFSPPFFSLPFLQSSISPHQWKHWKFPKLSIHSSSVKTSNSICFLRPANPFKNVHLSGLSVYLGSHGAVSFLFE
jgi:hypothetical protein